MSWVQWLRLRPTFEIELNDSREVAIEKIKQEQTRRGATRDFLVFGEYGELHLAEREHRLWSPHLSFYFKSRDDHCNLHGRFAPRVNVPLNHRIIPRFEFVHSIESSDDPILFNHFSMQQQSGLDTSADSLTIL